MAGPNPQRLYRSSADRMLGGVCGGLAHYFDVDPILMRLAWVAFTLLGVGITIPLYLVMWIIVPKEGEVERSRTDLWRRNAGEMAPEARRLGADAPRAAQPEAAAGEPGSVEAVEPTSPTAPEPVGPSSAFDSGIEHATRQRRQTWAGLVLVGLGLWLLANNLNLLWWLRADLLWPLVLLGIGAWLLYRQTVGRER